METEKQEIKEEAKQEERPEIVLQVKIDSEGKMTWAIPQDLRMAMYLNKHLDIIISKMHADRLDATIKQQTEIKKPNIITSIKNSPIIKRILR